MTFSPFDAQDPDYGIFKLSPQGRLMQHTPHPGAIGQVTDVLDSAGDSFLRLPYGMQPIIQNAYIGSNLL